MNTPATKQDERLDLFDLARITLAIRDTERVVAGFPYTPPYWIRFFETPVLNSDSVMLIPAHCPTPTKPQVDQLYATRWWHRFTDWWWKW